MAKPLISVVLPIYNAAPYLKACLESISAQSYKPLQLIAIDDHSTDSSWEILKSFSKNKPWVKIKRNSKNLGVSPTFNKGVALTKSNYLARMDADDLMDPRRLEKQLQYLHDNPQVVAVGTQCHLINKSGQQTGRKHFPTQHKQIREMLFRTVPMQQPSLMINQSLLPKNFLYSDARFSPAEDYDLFFRLLQYGQLANLSEFLHSYREHESNISLVNPKFTFWKITKAKLNAFRHYHYIPTLTSILVLLAQITAVTILPNRYIYPLYSKLRGMK